MYYIPLLLNLLSPSLLYPTSEFVRSEIKQILTQIEAFDKTFVCEGGHKSRIGKFLEGKASGFGELNHHI